SKGEQWDVTVIATDGKDGGPPVTASVTIANATPTATVSLTPEPASDSDIEAETTSADVDDDAVQLTYAWTVDGTLAPEFTTASLPADATEHGQTWQVSVTPNDGDEDGVPATASVVIQNVAPIISLVTLRPSVAYEETRLQASATGTDHDEDELTWTYTWFVSGGEVKSGAEDWLDGSDFSKGDNVIVEAIANDGYVDSEPKLSDAVEVMNTAPTLDRADLRPIKATEESELTCSPFGYLDVDGDTVNYIYSWTVDRSKVSATTNTLTGEHFDKHQEVSCTITPNDSTTDGSPVTSSTLTIVNTLPTLSSVAIAPGTADRTDTLRANVGSLSDPDDDRLETRLSWTVNGSGVSTGTTLAGAFKKGDKVGLSATPYDGDDLGTTVVATTITIKNASPTISTVSISPTVAYTDTTISGSVAATDPDSDKLSTTWTWTINGSSSGVVSSSIDGSKIKRGDKVQAFATVSDGTDSDGPNGSNVVTIKNTAPTAPSVTLTPSSPKSADPLVCEVTKVGTDLDGDKLTYEFDWERNGVAWTGGTATTDHAGDTIASKDTGGGQKWQCFATATDGTADSSEASSATVTIETGAVVPGFTGKLGPSLAGYIQCEGYLDKSGSEDIPTAFGDDCMSSKYNKIALACGTSKSSFRYIEVKKNVFRDKLISYPEAGLITSMKNQSGTSLTLISNLIYATSNDPHKQRSWWVSGSGCSETTPSLTVNNSCTFEASNCFGQNIKGDRYLWIYVKP
ncbi:MAG: hypothetical protein ACI9MC_004020, partial [Kiritimatiellia bacterium]